MLPGHRALISTVPYTQGLFPNWKKNTVLMHQALCFSSMNKNVTVASISKNPRKQDLEMTESTPDPLIRLKTFSCPAVGKAESLLWYSGEWGLISGPGTVRLE